MHGGGTAGTAAAQHAGRLGLALALTATYMVAEVVGGVVTGSLALLAEPHTCSPTSGAWHLRY